MTSKMTVITYACGHEIQASRAIFRADRVSDGGLCGACKSPSSDALQSPSAMVMANDLEIERRREMRNATAKTSCTICGAAADMYASHGPACPDHYDALS